MPATSGLEEGRTYIAFEQLGYAAATHE